MTTIAYKDGVVACDSRLTQGDRITDDASNKRVVSGKKNYYLSGCTADYSKLIAADNGEPFNPPAEVHALIWDGKRLWEASFEGGKEYWKCPKPLDKHCAIGSGTDHALTAMDMGADARTAVKMAMKRDSGTGGRVRTYKIKP